MHVANEDMATPRPAALHQLLPENGGSGAHVENNERPRA
jgi:hypothetical protein